MGKTRYLHSEVAIVAGWFSQSFLLLFYQLSSGLSQRKSTLGLYNSNVKIVKDCLLQYSLFFKWLKISFYDICNLKKKIRYE